jgi:hypothetical protein
MYSKAILFKDQDIADQILRETTTVKIKSLVRRVSGFDESIWVEHRERIVADASYFKFAHSLVKNKDIKALLLATRISDFEQAQDSFLEYVRECATKLNRLRQYGRPCRRCLCVAVAHTAICCDSLLDKGRSPLVGTFDPSYECD